MRLARFADFPVESRGSGRPTIRNMKKESDKTDHIALAQGHDPLSFSAIHPYCNSSEAQVDKAQQAEMAESFRARHRAPPVLLLPNAWDALSARLFVAAGFDALATTSGGLSWALGYPDGEIAPWQEVVAATARIVRAAQAPVTADIEAGYGATPAEVGAHVAEIIRTGVVGINLEDGLHGPIRGIEDAAARLAAAREAALQEGVPIVINARCDIFHLQHGEENARFATTVARCKAYLAAGADCVYPFGLRDPGTIAEFVKAVGAPVNITGRHGMPDAAAFEGMGVARITVASAMTLAAMSAIQKLAVDLRATGGFEMLASTLRHPDAQRLFQSKG
jgi:2-methylisocitrate lyase-like PEP mutase family enzyme